MRVLLTGAAGFIGYHVAEALLARGDTVIGVDCYTPYYSRTLKEARVNRLIGRNSFTFLPVDVAEHEQFRVLVAENNPQRIIHLAAQAGVRYSIEAPFAYQRANLEGHLSVLEAARHNSSVEHVIYASSSSVYGANTKVPFAETDRVDSPVSLYAATKRSAELMSETYNHLYKTALTGLRFFTVYGPWGRPDMAYWLFTDAILKGEPIALFANGEQQRDFTYIDDIVKGVLAAADRPPAGHKIYNLGNHSPERTLKLIDIIEKTTGKRAIIRNEPARQGDVDSTYADVTAATRDLGFAPTTSLETGLPRFIAWYRDYFRV